MPSTRRANGPASWNLWRCARKFSFICTWGMLFCFFISFIIAATLLFPQPQRESLDELHPVGLGWHVIYYVISFTSATFSLGTIVFTASLFPTDLAWNFRLPLCLAWVVDHVIMHLLSHEPIYTDWKAACKPHECSGIKMGELTMFIAINVLALDYSVRAVGGWGYFTLRTELGPEDRRGNASSSHPTAESRQATNNVGGRKKKKSKKLQEPVGAEAQETGFFAWLRCD